MGREWIRQTLTSIPESREVVFPFLNPCLAFRTEEPLANSFLKNVGAPVAVREAEGAMVFVINRAMEEFWDDVR